jgi:HK97 family phage prohead protease
MKIRSFQIKNLSFEEQDGFAYFEGYAAIFGNEDLTGDIIEKGAFRKTLADLKASNKVIPLLYQHNPDKPIGVVKEIFEDDRGLYIKGEINLQTEKGKEAYALLKQGALNGLSIGYEVMKYTHRSGKRILTEIKLWEISIVTFPANEQANIVRVKKVVPYQNLPLADLDTAWDANKARENVRKWASSDGSGDLEKIDWAKYRKAFLWYDEDAEDTLGAYKLPIADVIDGGLKAVPRAIFAAAAAIQGARGGVNIPASDIELIKAHLDKYYTKLDRIPPWEEEEKNIELDIYTMLGISQILETKEGKVLNARNKELIKEVIMSLAKLLEAAGEDEFVKALGANTSEPSNDTQEEQTEPPEEKHIRKLDEAIAKLKRLF